MKTIIIALVISFGFFPLTGCNTLGVGIHGPGTSHTGRTYHKQGPPPHAPAHGYRHKQHHGHDLVYDSGIDAYIVLNVPETYFGNDLYIRLSTDGRWLVSAALDGGWRLAMGNEVPYKLRESKEKNRTFKKGKKHKKQKYDDD